jgi:signal transduction histidine kinase
MRGTAKRVREEQDIIRQRIRLALINMVVLVIIWTALASFVYSMETRQTIHLVDLELSQLAARIAKNGCPECPVPLPLETADHNLATPDIHYVIWQLPQYHIVATFQPLPAQTHPYLYQNMRLHMITTPSYYSVEIGHVPYRVIQEPLPRHRVLQIFENIQDDRSRLARLLSLLAWGGAIGLGLSVLGGFLLGLWTLKPILLVRRRERELLSDVSHELRTPLTTMTTHAELLIRHASDPIEEHLNWIETIYSESQRMSRLVRNLLEMTYLEEGWRSLNLEHLSLKEFLESVAAVYLPVLEESGLTLTLDVPDNLMVIGDPMKLRQLLLIFLDNARKHTLQGGISIRVVIHGNHAEIHIQDTGEGMSDALRRRATERFVRGDPARHDSSSHGLGLAIAKKIVEAHHGRLLIKSTPGVGTDVIVILRLHRER